MVSNHIGAWAAALFIAAAAPAGQAAAAQADDWPRQAVTIVVPFAAGGGTDSIAREFAMELGKETGQSIVVENRGGGGGAIGAAKVAQSRPDGYTLLFATSTFATNAAWEKPSYDPETSFTPVALLGTGPLMLVANNELGVDNVAALLERAKAKPGEINYCSAGPGSINHLSGALFQQRTGLEITHVPYRGSGPATLDLLAGRVQIFFSTMPTMLENVKAGKVKLLAVTSKERSPLFPDVPTIREAGIADYDVSTWWGLLGPAGMDPAVVEKLNALANRIMEQQLLSQRLKSEGATVFKGSPDEFRTMLNNELAMWRKVVSAVAAK